MSQIQNYENHVRFVPPYHFFVMPVLLLNVLWSIYRLIRFASLETAFGVLVAAAICGAALFGRLFALAVQDRVIRLEMRLRLERLLSADLQARIGDFTVPQLVALRFASDEELPELARRVLAENLTDGKTIKRMVKTWTADFCRA